MSVHDRVQWLLAMPKGEYEKPFWVAEDLNRAMYKLGKDTVSKEELKTILMACANKGADVQDGALAITEGDCDQMIKDFFGYNEYAESCHVKIFILQFTRMDLFKTIRALRSQYGNDIPVADVYRNVSWALGAYQGEKMAKHVCPDRFEETCRIEALAEFYFRYEAMLAKDAVKGGSLASLDVQKELVSAVEDNAPFQVEILLAHPEANPNTTDVTGEPLLHVAITNGWIELASILLNAKADPNALSKDGVSGVLHTLEDGAMEMLQELIIHGADVNQTDTEKNSPLHIAVSNCNDFAVRALLKAGADRTLVNNDGKTAEQVAEEMEEPSIVAMLKAEQA